MGPGKPHSKREFFKFLQDPTPLFLPALSDLDPFDDFVPLTCLPPFGAPVSFFLELLPDSAAREFAIPTSAMNVISSVLKIMFMFYGREE